MPKTRQQKEAVVRTLVEDLSRAKAIVFADFQGLNASEIEALRRQCFQSNVGYIVAKKTLLARAFQAAGLNIDPRAVDGSVATTLGFDDEVTAAKVLAGFAKAHEALKIRGGILESRLVDAATVTTLSCLPTKQELLAKMVGSLQAPMSGLVRVLSGNLRGLVQVLKQIENRQRQTMV